MGEDDGAISIALTPIEMYAILNGDSISASELASNSWHRMPGPPPRTNLAPFMQPLAMGDTTAQIRTWLAQNNGAPSGPQPAPIYAPQSRQDAWSHQSHYSQPNVPDCWIPPAPHMTSEQLTRGGAVLQIIGAGLEMTGGVLLILTPEPTMVTKVGGGVLVAHSFDLGQAAIRQLFSGKPVNDMTEQATEWTARQAGASPETAHRIGVIMDVAVSFTDIGVGFIKLASIRSLRAIHAGRIILSEEAIAGKAGRVSLDVEEGAKGIKEGGHTLAKHVDPTRADLEARAMRSAKGVVTKFTSKQLAEDALNAGVQTNRRAIKRWLADTSSTRTLEIPYTYSQDVAEVFSKATGSWQPTNKFTLVFLKPQSGSKQVFLLTFY